MVTLYGTGGHASVVLNVLSATGRVVEAVFDDGLGGRFFGGLPVKAGVLRRDRDGFVPPGSPMIVCIGQNESRALVARSVGMEFATAVHPTAMVGCDVMVGVGTVIFHRAVVLGQGRIGTHAIINTAAVVGFAVVVDDFAHVSPGACLGDAAYVGTGSHVGAGAVVAPGIRIGHWCTVGAGAIVESDVADGMTVVGNPGRELPDRLRRAS